MNISVIEAYLTDKAIFYEKDVDLRKKTWIHRGGKALYYIKPQNVGELKDLIIFLNSNSIDYLVVGHTSNIYIRNSSDIDVVVSTLNCNRFEIKKKDGIVYLECDCGVSVKQLSLNMIEKGISGFEYLTELPGTVGAAIYNNSSCKTNSISKLLIEIDLLTNEGEITIQAEDLHFGYRTSDLKQKIIKGTIIRLRLNISYANPILLKQISEEYKRERKSKLEGNSKNLGCTVNRMFSNGGLDLKYLIPLKLYTFYLHLFYRKRSDRIRLYNHALLRITGYSRLIPYVSDKQMITFMWSDDGADEMFNDYIIFMKEKCKTNSVEIEII